MYLSSTAPSENVAAAPGSETSKDEKQNGMSETQTDPLMFSKGMQDGFPSLRRRVEKDNNFTICKLENSWAEF